MTDRYFQHCKVVVICNAVEAHCFECTVNEWELNLRARNVTGNKSFQSVAAGEGLHS